MGTTGCHEEPVDSIRAIVTRPADQILITATSAFLPITHFISRTPITSRTGTSNIFTLMPIFGLYGKIRMIRTIASTPNLWPIR